MTTETSPYRFEESVMIVEDEALVAEDLRGTLEREGIQVVGIASSVAEANAIYLEKRPVVALVDIHLDGEGDGVELAQVLRGHGVEVVFITGSSDLEVLDRVAHVGPSGYLTKPFRELDLRTTVALALLKARGGTSARAAAKNGQQGNSDISNAAPFDLESLTAAQRKIFRVLAAAQCFKACPPTVIAFLANNAKEVFYERGSLILSEGVNNLDGFLVTRGRVAVSRTSANGKELIVELLPPGEIFGFVSLLEDLELPYTLRAQLPTEVVIIQRDALMTCLKDHPEVERSLLTNAFKRLRGAHDLSRAIAHDRVEYRILSALLSLVPSFSKKSAFDGIECSITMTRQELAHLVGTTLETCVRVTKSLEREGLLELTEPGIIRMCSVAKLRERADEQLGD